MVDELEHIYQHFLKKMSTVPEIQMRNALAANTLTTMSPSHAVWVIAQVLRGALLGKAQESDAMLSISNWLITLRASDDYIRLQTLFETASNTERESVLFLLRDPPLHQALRKGARLPEVRLPTHRDTTLGERRTLARGTQKKIWKRLMSDPNPRVLREILINPRVCLDDVNSIAARRPTTVFLLDEIVKNARWFRESNIREALVQNPFLRSGTALRILPTVNNKIIDHISSDNTLHPTLKSYAILLSKLRKKIQ